MNPTYEKLLRKLISFKSVSTDPSFKFEIEKLVSWLTQEFKSRGFQVSILQGKSTNPVILASYVPNPFIPTILIYGHYDVQPAILADGWHTDPFTLVQKSGRLYGRGVVDNKGQFAIHIATIFDAIKEKRLKYNIKFLLEGNEETANPDLPTLIKKHKSLLKCDYVLVSDGEIMGNTPTIEVSLRGGFNLTLIYTTATNNVHSGIYGGAIPNAALELNKLLAKLYDQRNICQVPGFYKDVDKITTPKSKLNAKPLLSHIKVKKLLTEPNYDFFTQTGLRPTVQVTGLKSGYIDTGYANIIPATAEARLNFRIVTSQKSQDVASAFSDWVKANTPKHVNFSISHSGHHQPIKIDTSSPMFATVKNLLKSSFGKAPVIKYVGGAIPFVADVKQILGKDTLLVSLGNDDCNMHGANENYKIDLVNKALKFSKSFFSK